MNRFCRLRALVLGLGCLLAPLAGQADENDWLYFPMYPNDTAHAVHYKALAPRADGLLAAATRYPMHSRESIWPTALYEQAWYEYYQRLIDCESGLLVDTSHQLLSRDGRVLARRELGRADWLRRFVEVDNVGTGPRWPSGGEIFLSCAAPGDAGLKASRKRPVASRVAVIGAVRVTTLLGEDTEALAQKAFFRPDLKALAGARNPTAHQLFAVLQTQYQQWVDGFTPRLSPGARQGRASAAPAAVLQRPPAGAEVLGWLQARRVPVRRLEAPAPGEVRVSLEADPPDGLKLPVALASDVRQTWRETRIDCRSGLAVDTQWLWTGEQGKVLLARPAPFEASLDNVKNVLERSRWNDGSRPSWDQWSAEHDRLLGVEQLICRAAAAHCLGAAPPDSIAPLQMGEADFPDTLDTPEAFLLHAHELWLRHRQQRVPSCRF